MIALPGPAAPLPHAPPALVARLRATERTLGAAIDRWDTTQPPPAAVTRLAVREQGLIRYAAATRARAAAVARLDPAAADDVRARRDLTALAARSPAPRGRIRIRKPAPAAALLGWYREAQARFGIRWQLLAAINFVETAFGKVRNVSGAGARGPMQFEPATWRAYGLGGNVEDPHDAILGAANYLAANRGATDARAALYHYNRSSLYVDAVIRYARRIRSDPHAFFAYYNWRVYVRR
ncbi:MAG TPA: lytic transglycosylase domain-containing protein [Gaiellaceae bacterium]|nr:lytic transglycosylase domain-containing protein [Gaiellaceae bacterium]